MKSSQRIILTLAFLISTAGIAGAQISLGRPGNLQPQWNRNPLLPTPRIGVLLPPRRVNQPLLDSRRVLTPNFSSTPTWVLQNKAMQERAFRVQVLSGQGRIRAAAEAEKAKRERKSMDSLLQARGYSPVLSSNAVSTTFPPLSILDGLGLTAPAQTLKAAHSTPVATDDMEVVTVLDDDTVVLCNRARTQCRPQTLKGIGRAKRARR